MVKLNYAFKNGNLSLRISEKKERWKSRSRLTPEGKV